jgi:DNA-directed RNA polymerase subunit RPC12/RpoP
MSDVEEKKTHKFPCKGCGAELVFNPSADSLKCEFCGFEEKIPKTKAEIKEYRFDEHMAAPKETGFGTEAKSFKCQACGATTSVPAGTISTECAFCGSKHVFETETLSRVVRPESLLGFAIDRNQALEKFRQWIAGLWFRPNDLKHKSQLADIRGMYLPHWTFDAFTTSWWEAERGDHYYETEWVTEKDDQGNARQVQKQVQKTRWTRVSGNHQQFFDDELVCASTGVSQDMMRGIYPYPTDKLVPYEPSYLSGWAAEEYSIDMKQAWGTAKNQMDSQIRSACSRMVGGDTQRNLRVDTAFSNITYKHVLLPVWVAGYTYNAKVFQFLVNGQTGKVYGKAPYSWMKITTLIVVIVAIIALIVFLTRS